VGLNRFVIAPLLLIVLNSLAYGAGSPEVRLRQVSSNLPSIRVYSDVGTVDQASSPSLHPQQFQAWIDGKEVSVSAVQPFQNTGEGVGYIFLVDISKSLPEEQFSQIREALSGWIQRLGTKDRAHIVTFGTRVSVIEDFSGDKDVLMTKIGALHLSDQKTKLHQALVHALELRQRTDPDLPARRVIVVLSDGKDEGSGFAVDDVLLKIQEMRVPVFSIGYSSLRGSDKGKYLDVLHRISRASGGVFLPANTDSLLEIYSEIRDVIQRVFVLTLQCSFCREDGQQHQIQVNFQADLKAQNDEINVRFLPRRTESVPKKKFWQTIPWWVYGITGLFLIVLSVLIFRRTRNIKTPEESDLQPSILAAETGGVEEDLKGIAMRWTQISGEHVGKVYSLTLKGQGTVGSSESCDITLASERPSISGNHCELKLEKEAVLIRDLHSENGTLLNGVPIMNDFHRLSSEDIIAVGLIKFRISIGEVL